MTSERHAPQTELVIGLVGAVGLDLEAVVTAIISHLNDFDYRCHLLRLTELLRDLDWDDVRLVEAPFDERLDSYMTAGDELRRRWDRDDAFALLAVSAITRTRAAETEGLPGRPIRENATVDAETEPNFPLPLDRHAYIVRSLKRSEEADLLRDVYGSRFVLISAYSPKAARVTYLERRIRESRVLPHAPEPAHDAQALIARDEKEPIEHGQDVRAIFHRGDFFLDATGDLDAQVRRMLEILFGHPARTPTRDEFGMFQATAAARRSAELGRQVGAAVCTTDGNVAAVGVNEVPRAGGGLYWEGDSNDAREFTKGRDTSDERKAAIAARIVADMRDQYLLPDVDLAEVESLILRSELGDLIEFYRAVHAEMAALMDAARRGIAVQNHVLYVTTFPCHHCARHIVAAGLMRVVYIAPYPKSLAEELHGDAIVVDPHGQMPGERRVIFEPFVGVGPPRYLELFDMAIRKLPDGEVAQFDPKTAMPRLREIETQEMVPTKLPYIDREVSALLILNRLEDRGPRFR